MATSADASSGADGAPGAAQGELRPPVKVAAAARSSNGHHRARRRRRAAPDRGRLLLLLLPPLPPQQLARCSPTPDPTTPGTAISGQTLVRPDTGGA